MCDRCHDTPEAGLWGYWAWPIGSWLTGSWAAGLPVASSSCASCFSNDVAV